VAFVGQLLFALSFLSPLRNHNSEEAMTARTCEDDPARPKKKSKIGGTVFGVRLKFLYSNCDHGDAIGTDMVEFYQNDQQKLSQNKTILLGQLKKEAYRVLVQQLPQYYLNNNSNINYMAYGKICDEQKEKFRRYGTFCSV